MKKNYLKIGVALLSFFVSEESYAGESDAKLVTNDAGILAAQGLITMGKRNFVTADKETKETSALGISAEIDLITYNPIEKEIYITLKKEKDLVFCHPVELTSNSQGSRYTHVLRVGIKESTKDSPGDEMLTIPFNALPSHLDSMIKATISYSKLITICNAKSPRE